MLIKAQSFGWASAFFTGQTNVFLEWSILNLPQIYPKNILKVSKVSPKIHLMYPQNTPKVFPVFTSLYLTENNNVVIK